MKKKFIKKIIVSIVFISFLVLLFTFINLIKCNNDMSLVKNIIKNKYQEVKYDKVTRYLYAYNDNEYEVFDNNGNKLYRIDGDVKLNIVSVTKNYYIILKNEYYIYNDMNELITSSKNAAALNNYLIKVDDKIINYKNEIIMENVKSIKSYNNNKIFCINNKIIINKKGKIILKNASIKDEVYYKNKFYIIKKDKKYYTFLPNLEKIIGKGFNEYNVEKNIYIEDKDGKYKVLKSGIRKKVKDKDYPRNDYVLFSNGYKTIKASNKYTLMDKNNKIILELDKQIIINSKIKKGNINKYFYIYDLKTKKYYDAKTIYLKNNKYYIYKNNNAYLLDSNLKEIKESEFLDVYKNILVYKDNNRIVFKNLVNNKNKYIKLNNMKILSETLYKNILIVKDNNDIKVINYKGNIIKTIKDSEFVEAYYDKEINKIIIITIKDNYKGSYVCE